MGSPSGARMVRPSNAPPLAGLTRRVALPTDEPLRRTLFRCVRESEFADLPLRAEEREQLLESQFQAQWAHYRSAYPRARFELLFEGGLLVGNWFYEIGPEIRLLDLTLIETHRNRGIGSALLAEIIDLADQEYLETVLHVERGNPARRLYERFGFSIEEDLGVYFRMRRYPWDVGR